MAYFYFNWSDTHVVSLASVESMPFDQDFRTLDNILQKNDELQMGDWKKMSLAEKKAGTLCWELQSVYLISLSKAYYLAWGPAPTTDNEFRMKVLIRFVALFAATAVGYYTLWGYFRCTFYHLERFFSHHFVDSPKDSAVAHARTQGIHARAFDQGTLQPIHRRLCSLVPRDQEVDDPVGALTTTTVSTKYGLLERINSIFISEICI